MQADLSHFIIEDKQNLGWRFHWLRAEQQEPIDICAQKLNVSVDVIDKIESGQFDSPQVNLDILIRYLALYGEKFRLSFTAKSSASASETTNG